MKVVLLSFLFFSIFDKGERFRYARYFSREVNRCSREEIRGHALAKVCQKLFTNVWTLVETFSKYEIGGISLTVQRSRVFVDFRNRSSKNLQSA